MSITETRLTQHWLRWIAILALGIATLWIRHPDYNAHSIEPGSGYEAFALAESIVTKHSFSSPFWPLATGPSAHMAPLYPAYLGLIITVFGRGEAAVRVLTWSIRFMFALQVMMLPGLARRLGLGFWTGFIASVAWIACGAQPTAVSEATFAGLLILAAAFPMRTSFTENMSGKQLFVAGILWGALLLLQPAAVLVLFAWIVLLLRRSQASIRQTIVLAFLPLFIMSPWLVRNYLVFHKPVFIRDNFGMEMAVSNNPCASSSFEVNIHSGCYALEHPNDNYGEAYRVRELGEVEYNRVRLHEATKWIKANPRAFAVLSVERFRAFWLPPLSTDPATGVLLRPWIIDIFTLASVAGLLVMWRNERFSAYVLGLWLLFFPLMYCFFQSGARFRFPILWATFLPGAYFLVELARGLLGSPDGNQKSA